MLAEEAFASGAGTRTLNIIVSYYQSKGFDLRFGTLKVKVRRLIPEMFVSKASYPRSLYWQARLTVSKCIDRRQVGIPSNLLSNYSIKMCHFSSQMSMQ